MQASLRRGLVDRGGLVALVAAVVYAATASPYVVDGDNAEFVTLGTIGGVAHPTGYPAYLVWLRAWTWLPGNPAYIAAIATGVLAALGAWALHAACRAWGARPLSATIIAGAYALGPEVLRVATEAEVFAMNQLVAALVLWLAAEAGPLRGARRTLALAFVAGVGLADHVTCVMLAPVGVYGAVRGIRESARPAWLVVAGAIGALALGLAPYAYLAVTADTPAGWTVIDSPRALVDHMMRRDYGGPGAFSPHSEGIRPAANELALLATLGRGLLYAPLAIGLGWLAIACVRPRGHGRTEPAWAWRWLALSLVLAGPLLVARFDVDPVDLGLYVVRRFHLLPLVIASVPAAVGLDRLVAGLSQRYVALAGAVAIAGGLAVALPGLGRVHSPANEVGCANLLRSLPANAVVIGVGGEIHYAAAYLQLIAGVRPDVTIVTWPMTPQPAYRDKLAARGVVIEPGDGEDYASTRAAARILAAHRPLFVDQNLPHILGTYPTYPYGVLFRVLPLGTPRPPIEEVFAINKRVFDAFELGYELPGTDDEFATRVHDRYANTWQIIGRALAADGHADDARAAFAIARQIGPQP